MTIGTKLHQTLNSLTTVTADLKNYALETKDANAQKMYNDFANQLGQITEGLRNRVNYMESQEPQYQVYNKIANKQPKQ